MIFFYKCFFEFVKYFHNFQFIFVVSVTTTKIKHYFFDNILSFNSFAFLVFELKIFVHDNKNDFLVIVKMLIFYQL